MNDEELDRLSKLLMDLKGDKSLRQFAEELGSSYYALRTWIHKKNIPTPQNLEKISNYMRIELNELFSIIKDKNLNNNFLKELPDNAKEAYPYLINLPKEEKLKVAQKILNECV
ncbi:helix-turn-helix transcriptional regulator [Geminocystis sp. NIES-3709]|uniref:helix-turn-helix domain-containing protein n=1 Tax=Geminocystis sp. NIES-3709 TaxID=1617448 RepID=UPI0005FC5BCA|nr:helix-turn-helix transcriptional regulator [Geminocystis sp. NIES-3709]BAQ63898.1 hypothetical protein GM3709_663 [Geminocystis sp. NIES-3709]